jgi:Fe-S cluster biogenesis protein NfuA
MFIQTENTPNPNAFKFIPGFEIARDPIYFASMQEASSSFLARKILNIKWVESVFFGHDFITVNKSADGNWDILKPEILMTIMDHFTSGLQVFDYPVEKIKIDSAQTEYSSEIEKEIIEIIETKVRPAVAMDGGDIIYKSFEDGVVKLELHGACAGCPSSLITLKNGIESMLKHYVPEVKEVEAINNN